MMNDISGFILVLIPCVFYTIYAYRKEQHIWNSGKCHCGHRWVCIKFNGVLKLKCCCGNEVSLMLYNPRAIWKTNYNLSENLLRKHYRNTENMFLKTGLSRTSVMVWNPYNGVSCFLCLKVESNPTVILKSSVHYRAYNRTLPSPRRHGCLWSIG